MLLHVYVAWIAFWQAMFDPRLWSEAASSHKPAPHSLTALPAT